MLQQRTEQGIHYQAIFVDWNMPGMDGWQTSQHLRALQAEHMKSGGTGKAPVVVMVTAHGREMLSQRSPTEQALLDGFLVKPVTASMLFDAVIDARNEHDHPHPSRATAQSMQRRLEGMRLLLVEDNLNNQQVARELLEDEGALVQIANHGQEAVEAIAAASPTFDVVLMDLQMPVMDGYTAAQVIRNDLGLQALPIVAMTANAMASDREACLAAGMNEHVSKPFDLNDLVRVLRRQAQWGDALPATTGSDISLSQDVVQAAAAAGVDLSGALVRLGGKQEVYRRMLTTFVKDLQAIPEQLQVFAQHPQPDGTHADAKRLVHTLKGLAATLGAMALSTEAASAEKAIATSTSTEQTAASTHHVCTAIASALPGLQALLDALQRDHANATQGSAISAAQSLDRPALVAALAAMAQLLQANDMEAMNAMAELQQHFGEALGEDLSALEAAMAELEFDQALPLCIALLERYAPQSPANTEI
jgi:CheY-like chemotaxis protein/HPt (histidine-containing phosphotransfer) domain-containing protein